MALATSAKAGAKSPKTSSKNRFMHVNELVRMGADIRVEAERATICGKSQLAQPQSCALTYAPSASLVLAAMRR